MKTALSHMANRTAEPPISWLMKLALDRPNLVSLAAGFTDNASLPLKETDQLVRKVLKDQDAGRAALQYGSTAGDPALRKSTIQGLCDSDAQALAEAKVFAPADSLEPEPGRVLITHGSQQLLYLLTEALCDEGDVVLVEDPTYFVYLSILESRGVKVRGIRLDPDGIHVPSLIQVLEQLRRNRQLSRLKFLYVVSYFQNPSAVTMSLEKKREVLAVLKKYEVHAGHPIYLLEDAAYRELRFGGKDVASALAVEGGLDRVLYAGTYSKPFATGVRVGFGVLPEPVYTAALRLKGNHDFGTAHLLQQILRVAIEDGVYEKHLKSLQKRYTAKAAVMVQAIKKNFPSFVQWKEPTGGLYVWAALPPRIRTGLQSKCFETALEKEVLYVPGQLCYGNDPGRIRPNHEMRLSFGGATEAAITEGIQRLGQVLKAM